MGQRIDPRYGNNCLDAHVLDRMGSPEDTVVDEILRLAREGVFLLALPHSVKSEIEHPNTPSEVKRRAQRLLFTEPVELTPDEDTLHWKVRSLVQGNAKPGKHERDAYHLVESAKYGRYFITNDQRILKKGKELAELLPQLRIVTPTEFLAIFRGFEAGTL